MRRVGRVGFVVGLVGLVVVAELAFAHVVSFENRRLAQGGAACLGLVALAVASTGRTRDALLLLCSLAFGFVVLEGVAVWREAPGARWMDAGLRGPRPIVGWGPTRPGVFPQRELAADGHVVFDTSVTVDADLLRHTASASGPGAIAFFGDSFTAGDGIGDADTISQAFADDTGRSVPVLNIGFSAWSPAQALAIVRSDLYASLLAKPRRFILMTAAWHIQRTACRLFYLRGGPRFALGQGALARNGSCGDATPASLADFVRSFAFYRVFVEPPLSVITRADAETYFAIVDAFVKTAKDKYGTDTTIIVMPKVPGVLAPTGLTDADYDARLARSGADILVDPLPMARHGNPYAIEGDGHPTPLANRVLARLLLEHLRATVPDLLPRSHAAAP